MSRGECRVWVGATGSAVVDRIPGAFCDGKRVCGVPFRASLAGRVWFPAAGRAWLLKTKAFTYECADCGRQTSVTAGTIMHASKLPLTSWFWTAFLMATHSNGISALLNRTGFAGGWFF